ncbi:Protein of unknown function [Modestobacter sp. DSM 44400]|uniref:DUF4244 domain-containing protein n=1 Tax=Modestobacter sp. DSM 44400 TaxID=1550230 RepID=UPI0008950567|nr:DUF4244 domain-containing protein [Modestobacter sp. DSM 44400]SDX70209.1 Protein of unknown function [Modestobacter sp. DSM 44400]
MAIIEDEPRASGDQPPGGDGARRSVRRALADRWAGPPDSGEAGMSTAEYAVGTVAACAFAAVLYKVVTGGSVVAALGDLVQSALSTLS